MAQRLVRRLCPYCRKEGAVDGQAKSDIEATIASIEDKALVPAGRSKMWSAAGCDKCNKTGYKGRVGIYEAILMDERIEKAVQASQSDREIWLAARGQGLLTMKQDGVLKVLSGMTSLEELERVISITD
jgi:type II secretory ATPase GspE/PulE/Tfp pilus assembly ATPase PilB-like protein